MDNIIQVLNQLIADFGSVIIGVLMAIVGLLAVWVGIKFMMTGGDEQKEQEARKMAKNVFIGLVVALVIAVAVPLLLEYLQDKGNFDQTVIFTTFIKGLR